MGSSKNRVCGRRGDRKKEHGEKGLVMTSQMNLGRDVTLKSQTVGEVWLYVSKRLQGGRGQGVKEHRVLCDSLDGGG